MTLTEAKSRYEASRLIFEELCDSLGITEWDWYRALDHAKPNPIGRPNADRSRDAELVANSELAQTHTKYIKDLHTFYRLRDGEEGFLGGKLGT